MGMAACSHQATTVGGEAPRAGATEVHEKQKAGPDRYAVRHYTGAQDKPTEKVGVVSVSSGGMLMVESADDGVLGTKLREAVARMNEAETLTADAKPGDASTIGRGQPGFFEAERDHLRRLYGFELVR